MSDTFRRLLTVLIGAPVVLAVIYWGGWALALLVLGVAWIGQFEIYRLMKRDDLHPLADFGYVIGGLTVLAPMLPGHTSLALAAILLLFGIEPFRSDAHPFRTLGPTLMGVAYPAQLLSAVLWLRMARGPQIGDQEAFYLTVFVIVLIWATDICAYLIGKTFGSIPLAPKWSPNKTVTGAIGGIAGALVVGGVFKVLWMSFLPWIHALAVALLCGGGSQIGDLLESRFKRSVQVKDTGSLLPGHGGMLDRIDGLLFAVPVAFLYLEYIANVW